MKTVIEMERCYQNMVEYPLWRDDWREKHMDRKSDYNTWLVLRLTYPEVPVGQLVDALEYITENVYSDQSDEELARGALEAGKLEDRSDEMEEIVSHLSECPDGCNRVNAIMDILAGKKIYEVSERDYDKYRWIMS